MSGKRKTVFIDSSVFFTAVNSLTGGSAKLFSLRKYRLTTSTTVLAEVERNILKKLYPHHLERFIMLTNLIEIRNRSPNKQFIAKVKKIIVAKDAVILAEAKEAKTDYLVTLDIKHFFTEKVCRFLAPQKVITPKLLLNLKK